MTPKQEIIQYIMEENEFYKHVKRYLTEVCGHDLSTDPLVIESKFKNYVLMDSKYGTHTLSSMFKLIARKEGKKIEYKD
jgi:hypothetical protein